MPDYSLILAYGDGQRDHAEHQSEGELRIGSQIAIDGTCWQVVAHENDQLVCGPCLPIVFAFGQHQAPLFHADALELVRELRFESATRPAANDVANAIQTIVRGGDLEEVELSRDAASALRWAIHRLEIASHPLSEDMLTLRIELHRYLEDNPAQYDPTPVP